MKPNLKLLLSTAVAALTLVGTSQAQTTVYENLSTGATAGYSEANTANPIFGDALNLTSGGHLSIFGASLYNPNPTTGAGNILSGNMTIKFYDNTTPYAGGSLASQPLLGTAVLFWNFTPPTGLAPGFYSTSTFDLSALNINLTQNIFVTQQFTMLTGTSTRNGVVLFGNPTTGNSPATVYINSTATPEGLYTFSGGNPNQFGYHVEVVPEPTSIALAGLGAAALVIFRRRK